jgi:diguanylate cyclase (GGDEF)-like protein
LDFTSILLLNMYSFFVLACILVHAIKHVGINLMQNRLFLILVQITMVMLILDIFSRLDGNPESIDPILNQLGNFLIYLLNPVLPSMWLLYAHYQVFHDERALKSLAYPLLAVNIANFALLVFSQSTGWYYSIDLSNIYHRGPLFWIPAAITVILMLTAFLLIIRNRKRIEKRHYFSLILSALPPFICIILQIFFYGVSLLLNSVTLSLLIVFLNIQNHNMTTDYLTGVYNRKHLEGYLKAKIKLSSENRTFSAIMLDLDGLKYINDTFGHDAGDEAIETAITLIKSCIRPSDFIARYGGDEFYIVLDVSNLSDLESTVARIRECLEKFNETGVKPYKLRFSMGYALYDSLSHMDANEFQNKIDTLMYANKRVNQSSRSYK